MVPQTDFIVVGSGIAGLRAGIELARAGARVTVLTKDRREESNTEYAQGGVAVALSDTDEASLHEEDTLAAGAGLCDERAVEVLVREGRRYIAELIEWGAEFDREGGRLLFTREAAHSRPRILHAHGDATGREIVRALLARAGRERNISFLAHAETESLVVIDGRVTGVRYLDPLVRAPRFLLSEALRGEGGVLRNAAGRRFMPRYDDAAELAPRDVVTRSIVAEMERTATRTVFLDMTAFDAAYLRRRFPKIYSTCMRYGLDLAHDPVPVGPAAHYIMGGVRTDLEGRTTLPGLYAAGEVACTGVHGANRLASNSLLEGLVFGARAGRAAARDLSDSGALPASLSDEFEAAGGIEEESAGATSRGEQRRAGAAALAVRKRVRRLMWERVGILRSRTSLTRALSEFEQIARAPLRSAPRNFLTVATLIARAALWREESRGGHYRVDFPMRDDVRWRVHSIIQKDAGIIAAESVEFAAEVRQQGVAHGEL